MKATKSIVEMIKPPRKQPDKLKQEVDSETVDIVGMTIDKIELADGKYQILEVTDTLISKGSLNNVNSFNACLVRCQLNFIEGTGLSLPQGNFKDVVFRNCRFTLANFRASSFKRCAFIDCNLDEADFGMVKLKSVVFESCQLSHTDVSNTNCEQVEFIDCSLAEIKGISGLKGTTISELNLIEIAPPLASQAGIKVS